MPYDRCAIVSGKETVEGAASKDRRVDLILPFPHKVGERVRVRGIIDLT